MNDKESPSASLAGKKILHVIGDSKFGGDAVYMLALAEMARNDGADVSICTTTEETIAKAKEKNFPVWTSPKIIREINPVKDLTALVQMIQLCRKQRFDLVHTHTSKGGAIGRVGARLAGVPAVIHTIHGFAFHPGSSWLQRFTYENVERIVGKFCDLAISVNSEDRAEAITSGILPERKIITIKNGVDSQRFESKPDRARFRRELGVSDDELLVGTVSRFAGQKDPFTFIDAAERVLKSCSKVKFIYVGDGPQLQEARETVRKKGISDRFLMPGFVPSPESYFHCLDIFVTTALYEGLPIALIEAMCAGLPIVATNVKGNKECVDADCALLVEAKNAESIARAILRLLGSAEEREALGNAARRRFEAEFSQDQMLMKTKNAYLECIGERTGYA